KECSNYVRVLQPFNHTHLYICGTGAFHPVCSYTTHHNAQLRYSHATPHTTPHFCGVIPHYPHLMRCPHYRTVCTLTSAYAVTTTPATAPPLPSSATGFSARVFTPAILRHRRSTVGGILKARLMCSVPGANGIDTHFDELQDVFLMSSKDPKNPVIYAVFTTSR
ncbi:hypothetical protein CRUP_015845, partial [Coryphaenoides rupestris]